MVAIAIWTISYLLCLTILLIIEDITDWTRSNKDNIINKNKKLMNNFEKFRSDNSSTISTGRYYTENKTLVLIYENGGVYEYEDVPLFYWRGLFESASKGKFLNSFIFNKFKAERINLWCLMKKLKK